MATLDDLPSLPSAPDLSLDDLVPVFDLSDRRSPKKITIGQLGDLIGGSELLSVSTNADKLITDPAIGDIAWIYDEAGRIEQFTGAKSDPNKFFVSGVGPIVVDGVTYTGSANGYFLGSGGSLGYYEDTSSLFQANGGIWEIQVDVDGASAYAVTHTASAPATYHWEVETWIPAADVETEILQSNFAQYDNSGVVLSNPWGGDQLVAVPFMQMLGGKPYYQIIGNAFEGAIYYEEGRWIVSGDAFWYSELTDAVFPWQAGSFTIDDDFLSYGYPFILSDLARSPAATDDNWAVLKNTVELLVWNYSGADVTINNVVCPDVTDQYVGWVDPISIGGCVFGGDISLVAFRTNNYQGEQLINNDLDIQLGSVFTLPYAVQSRDSVYIDIG
jgi:hypothetical protein